MRLCIVGGALQGMEAAYLALNAGYETVIVDRRVDAPASSLGDHFIQMDPVKDRSKALQVIGDCDAVLPANENIELLSVLRSLACEAEVPLLFDMDAYRVSSSKIASNDLMGRLSVPMPIQWPTCGFPAVVKPSSQSGSIGVSVVRNEGEMNRGLEEVKRLKDVPVVQEYVHGRNFSVEVIGNGMSAVSYFLTEVILDENYDCKMVRCNPGKDRGVCLQLGSYAVKIAESMSLNGIMDIEAIEGESGIRILEVDARIPSQTPAAIYHATGVNLLKELVNSRSKSMTVPRFHSGSSIYEHVYVDSGIMRTCGEKMFSNVREPYILDGLFGADRVITDFSPSKEIWYATLIFTGRDEAEAENKRKNSISLMMDECSIRKYCDPSPGVRV
ncbi:MAG: 3-methylornithine--L-lysine ligase PylC [Candidatus Methanomethylophilaceae archaeon]